ncbi:MAG: hypothetical protein IPK16_26860 [Anaerolineales bacterium]|nr:hypothetical protein [Anaerolineales bacterium]
MAADHTLLISRIKPHTDFRATIESGPAKMAVIGLGKQRGALAMHEGGGENFQRYLAPAARIYEANTNLLGALCVVENAFDETAKMAVLAASEIGAEPEANLLVEAKAMLASLPFPEIDVLIVRELGKDISGTGMDTNVIGRLMIPRQPESFGNVDVAVIGVLDVTPASHGNATGIGLANLTTLRLAQKVDWPAMYTNGITSGIFGMFRNSLPMTLPSDRQLLEVAIRCCGRPPEQARIVLIQNTLQLGKIWVSPTLRSEVEAHPQLHLVDANPLQFDTAGNMVSPWLMAAPFPPRDA